MAETPPTITEAVAAVVRDIRLDGREHTARAYERGMLYFMDFIAAEHKIQDDASVTALTEDMFIRYLPYLSRKYSKRKTVSLYFAGAIKLHEYLIMGDYLSPTPKEMLKMGQTVKYVMKSSHEARLPKVPSDDDISRIVAAARAQTLPEPQYSRDIAIILFLAYSGCRNMEAVALRVGDVDLVARSAVVEGKGRKTRVVHFTQATSEALLAYWRVRGWYGRNDPVFARHDKGAGQKKHKGLTTATIRDVVDLMETAAGLEGVITPHKFRHHLATALLERTGDLALVQDTLGHASADTTRVYARLADQRRQEKYHEAFGE